MTISKITAISHEALSTLWDISFNGEFICNAITPPVRGDGIKVYGETAIDSGIYDCFIRFSPSKKRYVIELKDVINYNYIQLHNGNFFWDSDGCFIVGINPSIMNIGINPPEWFQKYVPNDYKLTSYMLHDSRKTLDDLIKIFKFKKIEKIKIEI